MQLNNNYRIDDKCLMVEVQSGRKAEYIDINNLPLRLQVMIVNSNNALLEYIVKPAEHIKSLIFSSPNLSV